MAVHLNIRFLGEVHEKQILRRGLPKKGGGGGLGQFADLRGGRPSQVPSGD